MVNTPNPQSNPSHSQRSHPVDHPNQQENVDMEADAGDTEEDEEDSGETEADEQLENADHQQLLDTLLALPGRENLPRLSKTPIPGCKTIWFRRGDKGKLARVIATIFRRNFDGPYFSWSVTPLHVQERYWRQFTRKYSWDLAITELVKEEFHKVAQRRMKGIVSQVKKTGKQPIWIKDRVWRKMIAHWKTPKAVSKSISTAKARNSHRGGLGRHNHVTGQMSFL